MQVYDGRDATAPVLGVYSGDMVDVAAFQDTVTTTGRDMFVLFHTDNGNAGIPAGHAALNG